MADASFTQNIIKKIDEKSARIGVVGLGYVGIPLMLRYAEEGFRVVGFDIDKSKVNKLNKGKSYISHISNSKIEKAQSVGFEATTDFSRISEVDAIILCVPTPLNKHQEPDLNFVFQTTESIVPYLRKSQIISLESTTYPGTTEEELLPRLESSGLRVGQDFFLVYSPEREDPMNPDFSIKTIPKICGGCTHACLKVGVKLYEAIIDQVVPVSSTQTAEMTKLLESIHRAVNIGLVNEMKVISDKMGVDIHEVIDAASTKPFGFVPYRPKLGVGGHCIPVFR